MKKLKKSNILLMICFCLLTGCGGPARFYGDQARLYGAVYDGRVNEVKELVKSNNVDINSQNNGLGTFLTLAATSNAEIIEILLDHGAQINQRDPRGFTPLMNAVMFGHPATVKTLIKRGADIKLEAKWKGRILTALSLAELYDHQEIIDILESTDKDKKRESATEVEKQNSR